MRIDKLVMNNYGPFFGEHTFNFSRKGLISVLGRNLDDPRCDSNGSGKSSLFDALDWGLFGKVPRGDHVDSIINEESRSCQVRIELVDDAGTPVIIERNRGNETNLRFWVGGEDRQALDTRETQAAIERVLGVDREVFHAAVYFGQGDLIRYADSTDSERMEILTRILQFEEIDELADQTKQFLEDCRQQEAILQGKMAALSGELSGIQLDNLLQQSNAWERERQREVQEAQVRCNMDYAALHGKQHEIAGAVERVGVELRNVQALLDGLPVHGDIPESARKELSAATHEHGQAQARVQMAEREYEQSMVAEICPTCGQRIPPEQWQAMQNQREACFQVVRQEAQQAVERLQRALEDVKRETVIRQQEDAQHAQQRKELIGKRDELQKSFADSRAQQSQLDQRLAQLAAEAARIQGRVAEVNPFSRALQLAGERSAQLKRELDSVHQATVALSERWEILDFWKEAFGAQGIKSYILDERLQEMTEAANRWVQMLTGGTVWVKFQAQRLTRGKKVINAPEVRVARWNPDGTITERNYRSWSGGEKQRISFGIDFGLNQLLSRRARQRYDLLILDEAFRHLDRAGREATVEMLTQLAVERGSIYVVDHDADMQGLFDQRVTIEKRNRRSVIREEESHAHTPKEEPRGTQPEQRLPAGAVGRAPVRTPIRRSPVASLVRRYRGPA